MACPAKNNYVLGASPALYIAHTESDLASLLHCCIDTEKKNCATVGYVFTHSYSLHRFHTHC